MLLTTSQKLQWTHLDKASDSFWALGFRAGRSPADFLLLWATKGAWKIRYSMSLGMQLYLHNNIDTIWSNACTWKKTYLPLGFFGFLVFFFASPVGMLYLKTSCGNTSSESLSIALAICLSFSGSSSSDILQNRSYR